MPTAAVRAVGIGLTASAVRQPTGREGHVSGGLPAATLGIVGAMSTAAYIPTATLGIVGDLSTAQICRRFLAGRRLTCMYADGPDKKPSAYILPSGNSCSDSSYSVKL